ncbi:MAG TPA: hypothetical protein PLU71_00890 [Candidatus Dependentiae bacterium]|nr:hypothetical protein [Candidatus Dependentiae bacterium]HRQ62390.1 hypothetical protein [Candidatus Dependentiae bacterium]
MQAPLIVIIYDGLYNSVFDGQVLQPLIAHSQLYQDQPLYLVSFEQESATKLLSINNKLAHHAIQLHILKKFPLINTMSLWLAIWQLRYFLKKFPAYELKIRGPLAGFIALHAMQKNACKNIRIQARGLAAEEYMYDRKVPKNTWLYTWHHYKVRLLHTVEQFVYNTAMQKHNNITIEAVSPALKEHLVQAYHTPTARITIAQHDIPPLVVPAQKTLWRTAVRQQLNIMQDMHVYCYNGSIKPWQCPQEVLEFFRHKYAQDKNKFLLILTQDIQQFKKLIHEYQLPEHSYHIATVPHDKIYHYLSACDTGIIFRQKHIVNWVARPTKILEYQAVGLKIVHNNTIGYLSQK